MRAIYLLWMLGWGCGWANIFVIGDSHVRAFQGIPRCHPCHLGPITMHRVGRDGLDPEELRKFGVRDGAVVVYVFGEIDVRCHIGRQRDIYQRDETEVLQTLVTNYLCAIAQNRSSFRNLLNIVCNVIPPTDLAQNVDYPIYGSLEDRARITVRLNQILQSRCQEYGLLFLNVYDFYANGDGSLRTELSDGNVHIHYKYNQPIRQELSKLRTSD